MGRLQPLCTALLLLSYGEGLARGDLYEGTVFSDLDGDGVFSAGDAPLEGVTVVWETSVWAATDSQGRYSLTSPRAGIIWVRTPDGFEVAPVWRNSGGDLALRPAAATGPVSFVHASDTHVGVVNADETAAALLQATSLEPRPHFLVITGDITQGNSDEEFMALERALADVEVSFVPVVGNHDWYDGGANYRRWLGPPTYSFDAGGAHFVVLNDRISEGEMVSFLRADLATVPETMPVSVFVHVPPGESLVAAMADAGVDYVFSGHWHANRMFDHLGLVQVNTEPLVMGGIDYTPAGYRVVTIGEAGSLAISHHVTVDEDLLSIVSPRPGACIAAGPLEVIAAVELGASGARVFASLDGGEEVELAPRGAWAWAAGSGGFSTARGEHRIAVRLERPGSLPQTRESDFCARDDLVWAGAANEWPQLQGGAEHHGSVEGTLAPPLHVLWASTTGGHLRGGSPVLADGRLFVPVIDLADGQGGGVLALDAATGARLWARRVGTSVHNAPAVQEGLVVFGDANGLVHAVRAEDGGEVWSYDLGEGLAEAWSWLYAAPTIADGHVYVGVARRFAALDLATGRPRWELDPSPNATWLMSMAAAGVADGVVVASVARGWDGILGLSVTDGSELWRIPPPLSIAVSTSAVIEGGVAYLGNSATQVFAVDLATSEIRWSEKLVSSAHDWSYGLPATFAVRNGRLFVPTQHDALVALDAATGVEQWRRTGDPSLVHAVHYGASEPGAFMAAPVVTGDLVWAGGADGILRAIDAATGIEAYTLALGSPILSGLVPAGNALFVSTFDGTVRALVSEPPPILGAGPPDGCGCAVSHRGALPAWAVAALVLLVLRRRARDAA